MKSTWEYFRPHHHLKQKDEIAPACQERKPQKTKDLINGEWDLKARTLAHSLQDHQRRLRRRRKSLKPSSIFIMSIMWFVPCMTALETGRCQQSHQHRWGRWAQDRRFSFVGRGWEKNKWSSMRLNANLLKSLIARCHSSWNNWSYFWRIRTEEVQSCCHSSCCWEKDRCEARVEGSRMGSHVSRVLREVLRNDSRTYLRC